ncbi:GntR family transcriptional regulator [Nocardioides sp. KIGAM211]|uniref:GntR family transcriptional regulator n=1 Tax=Nocardioides luti TaxID=2761101 RepID=A0A7X0VAG4_9ACTN|nr:GntR family transcriptional regulator [Nocardioides luti]MBB6627566.1 GntR family transcriptional regulator [Nocardioides luti]
MDMRIARPETTVREQVVEAVRTAIVSGFFQPGQRLTEKRLIEETGASRTSIREALRDLENHHLIERTGTNAIRVSILDEQTINDIYDVRAGLESLAAQLCVERASGEQLEALYRCVSTAGESVEERIAAAAEFDRLLLEAVGNEVLTEILGSLHWRVQVVRRLTMTIPGRAAIAWQQMSNIAEALRDRDGSKSRDLTRAHIESARAAALTVVDTFKDPDRW